jgi:hypothetical protein
LKETREHRTSLLDAGLEWEDRVIWRSGHRAI